MTGSVALDVVIGLVFIYLLYSLLATVLSEIIATNLNLRARNLKEAVNRMLADEGAESGWQRLRDSLKLMKNPDTTIINEFYNHPEIKYLGSSGLFKSPSAFKALSFSKTLLNLLSSDQPMTRELLDEKLNAGNGSKKQIPIRTTIKSNRKTPLPENEKNSFLLDQDTSTYLRILWADANGDIAKFRFLLEGWFDRTMEQATEWYKRKIQAVLLIIGFGMAWFFNADTFAIIKKLSVDQDAREKMVSMANTYIQTHERPGERNETPKEDKVSGVPGAGSVTVVSSATTAVATTSAVTPTTAATSATAPGADAPQAQTATAIKGDEAYRQQKIDSLIEVKNELQADIAAANDLLGLGAWLPDSLPVKIIRRMQAKDKSCVKEFVVYSARYNTHFTKEGCDVREGDGKKTGTYAFFSFGNKLNYLFSLLGDHFLGFLITAIAISLGAPFWFDLLSKLMKLRASVKEETDSTEAPKSTVSPDKRVG